MSAGQPVTLAGLRRLRAQDIVLAHTAGATGSMLVPVPGLDVAVELAVQVRMARELCRLYGAPFPSSGAAEVISGILGGLSIGALGVTALRAISFASYFAGTLPSATTTAAYTWLLGEVLIRRLEETGRIDLPPPAPAVAAPTAP